MDLERIIQEVADRNGVSAEEVRREMQAAVDLAWANRTDEKPSLEEFIIGLARYIAE